MTLTPEQFNKLVTKDDLKEMRADFDNKFLSKEEFHDVMDAVIKKLDNIEHNFTSNQVAHDRFEERLTDIEDNIKIKSNSYVHDGK